MKKGQTDIFMDVMSYVLFTVIVIVFFLIFHLIKGCNNPSVVKIVSEDEMRRDIDLYLVNILRSPVPEGQMTDLIWLYYQDDSYKDRLESELKDALSRVRTDYPCWEIQIIDEDVIFDLDNGCNAWEESRETQVIMALPMNEKSLTLRVRLKQYDSGTDMGMG